MVRANDKIQMNESVRSIILINAGGMIDLSKFLDISTNTTVYVIDSHRPFNLKNLFMHENVFFINFKISNELGNDIR